MPARRGSRQAGYDLQYVAQLAEPRDLLRIQRSVILAQELLAPSLGQQAQDLGGIIPGP
jgi:hypothetical protein